MRVKSMASGGTGSEEYRQQVLSVQELFKGRFQEREILALLRRFNFDNDETVEFIMNHEPKEIRDLIQEDMKANESFLSRCDEAKRLDVQKMRISCRVRQFACQGCDNMWWKNVPTRKPVSECNRCHQKFDPVPKEYEWGRAKFLCLCGNTFTGFCQKTNSSQCYKCGEQVFPTTIHPPKREPGPRRSTYQHSCDAPDCSSSHPHNPTKRARHLCDAPDWSENSAGSRARDYPDIDKAPPKTCVKAKVKNVLYPSNIHVNGDSTVASFLPDSSYRRSVFRLGPGMPDIGEVVDDMGSDSD
ncbi:shiftless antiviral inhibitor of ribosomal frameshifting protein homolog [Liolophura sinensis]|uniref:shiftless antiviral inhibitor of ribosomal frameshifting protein homolog n=1 Tax=Liolophura sinensis TaxID=3198878 RepID=UPI0031594F4E